jgi:hypothetical protein
MIHRYLARFAMSLFVISAVLAWEAYRAISVHEAIWRVAVDLFAASAALAMGVVGTREKHRREL